MQTPKNLKPPLGLPGGSLKNTGHCSVSVSVARNIELLTHALFGITVIFIPDKDPKYRTVRLNTGHLATLTPSPEILLWLRSWIKVKTGKQIQ